MKNKILAISLLSVFVFGLMVSGASAETKADKKIRLAREKAEKKMAKRNPTATSTSSVGTGSSSSATTTQSALDCVKDAVVIRENSITSTFTTYSSSMTTAYQNRLSALQSAWSNANPAERKTAVKKAWDDFKTTSKSTIKTMRDGNKTAWETFETARKSCKGGNVTTGSSEDNEGKGVDVSVSN